MQQNASYRFGDTGSPEIACVTTASGTLRMRTLLQNSGPKVEFTCLSLGGMIKATVPENLHIESVDPEPGVGYGWSGKPGTRGSPDRERNSIHLPAMTGDPGKSPVHKRI